jgi:hypothetical protein
MGPANLISFLKPVAVQSLPLPPATIAFGGANWPRRELALYSLRGRAYSPLHAEPSHRTIANGNGDLCSVDRHTTNTECAGTWASAPAESMSKTARDRIASTVRRFAVESKPNVRGPARALAPSDNAQAMKQGTYRSFPSSEDQNCISFIAGESSRVMQPSMPLVALTQPAVSEQIQLMQPIITSGRSVNSVRWIGCKPA